MFQRRRSITLCNSSYKIAQEYLYHRICTDQKKGLKRNSRQGTEQSKNDIVI